MYDEEDFLMISGLQHFSFCRRQWALIHIEQQWAENGHTVDGELFHENAHNSSKIEKRGDIVIVRGLRVQSRRMGLSGICDVVEFHRKKSGISMNGFEGLWIPYPVEYKVGQPKENDADILQLCAEAMCLEEMLLCDIQEGSMFYGKTRRRLKVKFSDDLRNKVISYAEEMHHYWNKGYTPKVKTSSGCKACSLRDICVPKLNKITSVKSYINKQTTGD